MRAGVPAPADPVAPAALDAPRGRRAARDEDLDPVDERRREVQRREIGRARVAPPARRTASAIAIRRAAGRDRAGELRLRRGRRGADAAGRSATGSSGAAATSRLARRAARAKRWPTSASRASAALDDDERGRARDGDAACADASPGNASQVVHASVRDAQSVAELRGYVDEVDELARDDHRRPRLAAVRCALHALRGARQRDELVVARVRGGTCRRSRSFPFTCTTTSTVSSSSSAGSATGHGCSHSRSCPSRYQSSSATCGAYGWISETAVSAAKRASRPPRVARELVDELHHRRDRRC